jgi:putative glutamine amidotransferase
MSRRPVIGVPAQTLQAIDRIPEDLPHSWVMNSRYLTALESVGAAPLLVPLLSKDADALRSVYHVLDGVFLAGGVDVDPLSYGEDRREGCGSTDLARDSVELKLTEWAWADGKPLLGVCRGLQIINIVGGGTLVQDCALYHEGAIKHDYFPTAGYARDLLSHDISIASETRLRRIYEADTTLVNSMHHQAIARLGDGLVVSGVAEDGIIEAVERRGDAFLVGVQWHPEMLVERDAGTRRLFQAFVDAACDYGSRGSDEGAA